MKKAYLLLLGTIFLLLVSCNSSDDIHRQVMDISGQWNFQLDREDAGKSERWFLNTLSETVELPGTTDENHKGDKNDKIELNYLTRKYTYVGKAWYQREIVIPETWSNKSVQLFLERTKATEVWVDEHYYPLQKNLVSPHIYILNKDLAPGKHRLTISVDNTTKQFPIGPSHALSEHTQTNWNGIIGRMELIAKDEVHIEQVKLYPDVDNKTVKVVSFIKNNTGKSMTGNLSLSALGFNGNKHKVGTQKFTFNFKKKSFKHVAIYKMGDEMALWDEFDPNLYHLKVIIKANHEKETYQDEVEESFGMVDFSTKGTQFVVNGKVAFLRGKHDACVFPLTGYPPMKKEEWVRQMRIAKEYGINHYRFHSYTPPKSAFEAADIVGIYMQPELPLAKTFDSKNIARYNLEKEEGEKIFDTYANHPSFTLFSLGNELRGDVNAMNKITEHFKAYDGRCLFTHGSNNFFTDPQVQPIEDFFVSARTKIEESNFVNDIRASFAFVNAIEGGYINGQFPNTERTFESALKHCKVPAVGHETGQYQVLPNFDEIPKYTGIVEARNFKVFQQRMKDKNMFSYWKELFMASGKHSAICYKEDNEMSLRTPGFGGFQILDLQDYPGQGTALVGMLDAFMDSKGIVTPQEWRQACAAQTIQAKMPKLVWQNNEAFSAELIAINYGEKDMLNDAINWEVKTVNGEPYKQGTAQTQNFSQGKISPAGSIRFALSGIEKATQLQLSISIKDGTISNTYDIWVYPLIDKISKPKDVTIVNTLNKSALNKLAKGGKVLLLPEEASIKKSSVGGLFISDYWCYPMFRSIAEKVKRKVSPGTLGLLINQQHPIFKNFPTQYHSNWQWWSIMNKSRPIILDETDADYRPIVQAIDNFERCSKLGTLFEFNVGKGKLMVCSANLRDQNDYVAQSLLKSILEYMESASFAPSHKIEAKTMLSILYGNSAEKLMQQANNEVEGYFFFD